MKQFIDLTLWSVNDMETIKAVLMRRDGISENDADNQINIALDELRQALDDDLIEVAYDVCLDHLGLEPDYLMELMEMM